MRKTSLIATLWRCGHLPIKRKVFIGDCGILQVKLNGELISFWDLTNSGYVVGLIEE